MLYRAEILFSFDKYLSVMSKVKSFHKCLGTHFISLTSYSFQEVLSINIMHQRKGAKSHEYSLTLFLKIRYVLNNLSLCNFLVFINSSLFYSTDFHIFFFWMKISHWLFWARTWHHQNLGEFEICTNSFWILRMQTMYENNLCFISVCKQVLYESGRYLYSFLVFKVFYIFAKLNISEVM